MLKSELRGAQENTNLLNTKFVKINQKVDQGSFKKKLVRNIPFLSKGVESQLLNIHYYVNMFIVMR